MTQEHYKIRYDSQKYAVTGKPNEAPASLVDALKKIDAQMDITVHNPNFHSLGVSLSPEKLSLVQGLDGILSVAPDLQYAPDAHETS